MTHQRKRQRMEENTVNLYFLYTELQRAVSPDSGKAAIETIRKNGYCINSDNVDVGMPWQTRQVADIFSF